MSLLRRSFILFLAASSLSVCWGAPTYKADFSDYTPRNAAIRSALLPGWGQWFNGDEQKGVVLGSTTLIATAVAAYLFVDSNGIYNQYTSRGVPDDPLYDTYKRERTEAFIAVGAASIGYVAGILDAYYTARRRQGAVSYLDNVHFAMDTTGRAALSYDLPF